MDANALFGKWSTHDHRCALPSDNLHLLLWQRDALVMAWSCFTKSQARRWWGGTGRHKTDKSLLPFSIVGNILTITTGACGRKLCRILSVYSGWEDGKLVIVITILQLYTRIHVQCKPDNLWKRSSWAAQTFHLALTLFFPFSDVQ